MNVNLTKDELAELKKLLKKRHINITAKKMTGYEGMITDAHLVFPPVQQQLLVLQLLENYESTKKKEVIILEELESEGMPVTFVLGALAEDWAGMSNSILGIVHYKKRNVRFIKGFTIQYDSRSLGIVILAFQIMDKDEYLQFLDSKKELILDIKDAAHGSIDRYMLMNDEAIKGEIFHKIIRRLKELHLNSDLQKKLEDNQEVLKFVSARSREYLEERSIKDLTNLVITNYVSQEKILNGAVQEVIIIKNMKTSYEELTGITFVCKEDLFSIEDFLKTLEHIVPGHFIKHHKSYSTRDGVLVYRIEIVDRNNKTLDSKLIKSIETSMDKLITISCSEKFTKLKSIGGFEHYARAIIPFLIEEVKKTKLSQVFINIDSKTEFFFNIKLIIVSFKGKKSRIYNLLSRLSLVPGIEISSSIPPRIHSNKIEINMLKLKVKLPEFKSIKEIYNSIKDIVKRIYGDIRDFDEGFRDIYIKILNQLLEKLKTVDASLIREIFFNIDELYKIEISPNLLLEIIRLCSETVEEGRITPPEKVLFRSRHIKDSNRTVVIISYVNQKRLMSRLAQQLKDVDSYFTQIEWEQRSYLIMILSRNNIALDDEAIEELKTTITPCQLQESGKNDTECMNILE